MNLFTDFYCISIKSKKETNTQCGCPRKKNSEFCGRHNRSKIQTIFVENGRKYNKI